MKASPDSWKLLVEKKDLPLFVKDKIQTVLSQRRLSQSEGFNDNPNLIWPLSVIMIIFFMAMFVSFLSKQ